MTLPLAIPPPGFDELPVAEKVEYVQSLWERIAAQPETVPVPKWHREMLAERVESYRRDPTGGEEWETVRRRLRKKLEESASR